MSLRPLIAFLIAMNILVWGALFAFEAFVAGEASATATATATETQSSSR
ncbi:MAG TPA: hypothetical protein VGR87_02900 [Candidatus Limnocylindria bacterium]|jgi:hypothetical protein|nr:hypothetical protein [Candidatus Limnocylindria bacterium]